MVLPQRARHSYGAGSSSGVTCAPTADGCPPRRAQFASSRRLFAASTTIVTEFPITAHPRHGCRPIVPLPPAQLPPLPPDMRIRKAPAGKHDRPRYLSSHFWPEATCSSRAAVRTLPAARSTLTSTRRLRGGMSACLCCRLRPVAVATVQAERQGPAFRHLLPDHSMMLPQDVLHPCANCICHSYVSTGS